MCAYTWTRPTDTEVQVPRVTPEPPRFTQGERFVDVLVVTTAFWLASYQNTEPLFCTFQHLTASWHS